MAIFVRLLANSALSSTRSACFFSPPILDLSLQPALSPTCCAPARILVAFLPSRILHPGRPKPDQLHDLLITPRSCLFIVASVFSPLWTCCGDPFWGLRNKSGKEKPTHLRQAN
jgi:hypothetical protein